MKSKSFILMIVSLGFGLIAAIGISQVMGKNGNTEPKLELGPVVVSLDHLDHNTILTDEMVAIENWPKKIIPENALTSLEEVKDHAVTRRMGGGVPLTTNDVVHKLKLKEREIPSGFRVYAMKVTAEETVNGLLRPGDFVDVIGTFRVRDRETEQQKTVSATFLKKIRVFNINGKLNSNPDEEEGGSKSTAIVGVLVRQQQAEQIALVEKEGTLKIIMRGENDDDDTPAESLADVLGDRQGGDDEGDDTPVVRAPKEVKSQMKIWSGSSLEIATFKSNQPVPETQRFGEEPISTGLAPKADSNGSKEYGSSGKSEDFLDSDGDFEEDQYPGE